MSDVPLSVPDGYTLGTAERRYVEAFESLVRQNIPMTPSDFYQRMGRPASTFARYRVLKAALNEYGWQTQPARMRGQRPSLLQDVAVGPDPRLGALERTVAGLTEQLKEVPRLREELQARDLEIVRFRSALMATIAHFSSARMSRATGIERKLAEVYRELLPPDAGMPFLGGPDGNGYVQE